MPWDMCGVTSKQKLLWALERGTCVCLSTEDSLWYSLTLNGSAAAPSPHICKHPPMFSTLCQEHGGHEEDGFPMFRKYSQVRREDPRHMGMTTQKFNMGYAQVQVDCQSFYSLPIFASPETKAGHGSQQGLGGCLSI